MNKPNGKRPSGFSWLLIIGFVSCSIALLTAIFLFWAGQRQIEDEIEVLSAEKVELEERAQLVDERARQAEMDQDLIWEVLRQTRVVEDIPDCGGDRIVSCMLQNGVAFYVPSGNHQLSVEMNWELTTISQGKDTDASNTEKPNIVESDSRSWTIELIPQRGYLLNTFWSRKPGPVGWTLSGNDESFTTLTQKIEWDNFESRGGSWSQYRIARYPNQVDSYSLNAFKNASKSSSPLTPDSKQPLRIAKWTRRGVCGELGAEIVYDVKLVSDNPPVVLASEEGRGLVETNRADRLGEYLGGGRYAVEERDASQANPAE